MTNDSIADMLTRIKNGYLARKKSIDVPYSKFRESLAVVFQKLKFVGVVKTKKDEHKLTIELIYQQGKPVLTDVKRMSKPGLRRYLGVNELKTTKHGLGYLILSTPKGLMTRNEAQKNHLGGELICKIW